MGSWLPQSFGKAKFAAVALPRFEFYLFRLILKRFAKTLTALAFLFGVHTTLLAQIAPAPYNDLILEQVRQMPKGGRYAATRVATIRLQQAAHFESGKFFFIPNAA